MRRSRAFRLRKDLDRHLQDTAGALRMTPSGLIERFIEEGLKGLGTGLPIADFPNAARALMTLAAYNVLFLEKAWAHDPTKVDALWTAAEEATTRCLGPADPAASPLRNLLSPRRPGPAEEAPRPPVAHGSPASGAPVSRAPVAPMAGAARTPLAGSTTRAPEPVRRRTLAEEMAAKGSGEKP